MQRLMLLAIPIAALFAPACAKSYATQAQCGDALERGYDLKVADEKAKHSDDSEQPGVRSRIRDEMKDNAKVKIVRDQCTTDVTPDEAQCAVDATTYSEWDACIR